MNPDKLTLTQCKYKQCVTSELWTNTHTDTHCKTQNGKSPVSDCKIVQQIYRFESMRKVNNTGMVVRTESRCEHDHGCDTYVIAGRLHWLVTHTVSAHHHLTILKHAKTHPLIVE